MKANVCMLTRLVIVVLLTSILLPSFSHAQSVSFNPSTIISDDDFFRIDDMSVPQIQSFLQRMGSTLATYRAVDKDGTEKYAAEIIFRASHDARINPKVVLVLLQKEQSLIENPSPSQYNYDWATGFARCDSCTMNDPNVAANKGFVTQVSKAAARKRYYVENFNEFQSRPGVPRLIDSQTVIPSNAATAALYNYTPHIRGNFSFWKLWLRYFEKFYPDGTIVQTRDNDTVWLIQNGMKRRFASLGVFLSRHSPGGVVTVDASVLEKYPEGAAIKFPQYSLLQSKKGAVFLLVDDKKYGIPSRAIFRSIGFNPDEVIRVADADLSTIETGGLIFSVANNPLVELFQDTKTGGVYAVENGIKHPILERAILKTNFPYHKIVKKTRIQLDRYTTGDAIRFADGTLVSQQGEPAIYIISNGEKRPFANGDVFESLGYRWSQVVGSSGKTLTLHSDGDMIHLGITIPEELPTIIATRN